VTADHRAVTDFNAAGHFVFQILGTPKKSCATRVNEPSSTNKVYEASLLVHDTKAKNKKNKKKLEINLWSLVFGLSTKVGP
jgi:hypothetical protein